MNEKPEFDFATGTLESDFVELTYLGGLLLRRLGLIEHGQIFFGELQSSAKIECRVDSRH